MIKTIAVTKQNEILTNAKLKQLFTDEIVWYWVDFDQPTMEEIEELERTFHFHPLAIEDCIHKLQRPKLDYYHNHTFFVIHNISTNERAKEEVNFFLGKDFVISFHHTYSKGIKDVWQRLIHSNQIEKWNQLTILYEIMDKIVDNYFPILYELEDELNSLENNQEDSMEKLLEKLYDIRHALLNLRHTVIPMRDLLYRMLNSHRLEDILERKEYFSNIHDHLLKLTEMIDANREITTDIRDSYLSINSHQTNHVMKVLTVITTIFMPLTFIAGIYGMNFQYMPELTYRYGYIVVQTLMIIIGLGMFIWFRKKGWFN